MVTKSGDLRPIDGESIVARAIRRSPAAATGTAAAMGALAAFALDAFAQRLPGRGQRRAPGRTSNSVLGISRKSPPPAGMAVVAAHVIARLTSALGAFPPRRRRAVFRERRPLEQRQRFEAAELDSRSATPPQSTTQKTRKQTQAAAANWWQLVKQAFNDWLEDKAPRLGAALAYYTVFSIAPLLIIALAIAGWVFGDDAVNARFDQQMQGFLGAEGARAVQSMVAAANQPAAGTLATALSVVVLIFGASGVFGQMKDAMNTIWEVEPKPDRGVWGVVRDRILTFAMVLGIAFLLLVTLIVSAILTALTSYFSEVIPGPDVFAHALDVVVSLGVVTMLFALIFKFLPDVRIAWRDVWLGAIVTAVLFTIGKYAIGVYLGTAGVGSAYGAAGSIVIVLLWAYYSSQILFFGAELTQAYARMRGSEIRPTENAVAVTQEMRAQQGMA